MEEDLQITRDELVELIYRVNDIERTVEELVRWRIEQETKDEWEGSPYHDDAIGCPPDCTCGCPICLCGPGIKVRFQ